MNFTGNWTVNEGTRGGVFSRNKNNWWKLEFYSFYLISCFSLCRDKSLNWHNGTKWISSGIRQKKLWLNAVWLYLLDEILIQLLPSSSWLHSERRKTRQDLLRSTLWPNMVSSSAWISLVLLSHHSVFISWLNMLQSQKHCVGDNSRVDSPIKSFIICHVWAFQRRPLNSCLMSLSLLPTIHSSGWVDPDPCGKIQDEENVYKHGLKWGQIITIIPVGV